MSKRSHEELIYRVIYRWNPAWDWRNEVTFGEYGSHEKAIDDALILRQIKQLDCVRVDTITYRMEQVSERVSRAEWITLEGDDDGEQD
jgi:hypothetical protein